MSRRFRVAGLGLAPVLVVGVLAVAPAMAFGAAPTVTNLTVRETGSNGGVKGKIDGTGFTEATANGDVNFGLVPLKHVTGTLAKGQFKVISSTEIEFDNPFHEHGKVPVTVCVGEECSGSKTETTPADEFTYWDEIYRAETVTGNGAHVATIGYGEILLKQAPHPTSEIECVNVGFGAGWNEPPTGQTQPVSGHGEILVWWASGHSPGEVHTELSSRCRFIYEGINEEGKEAPEAWATAEPPLHKTEQTGIVCKNINIESLENCKEPSERHEVSVVEDLYREALTLPWNIQFTERAGKARVRIGLPDECKGKTGPERTELEKCPEASERESGTNPAACVVAVRNHQAPAGCVKVTIVTNPKLNLELPYEGYVEPFGSNGAGSGLTPGSWAFEGEGNEECLHLVTSPETKGCTTGAVKVLGYSNQELISVK